MPNNSQVLIDYCNETFNLVSMGKTNTSILLKSFFEIIENLEVLYNAEQESLRKEFYEKKAKELLTIIRYVKKNGYDNFVSNYITFYRQHSTFLCNAFFDEKEVIIETKPDPIKSVLDSNASTSLAKPEEKNIEEMKKDFPLETVKPNDDTKTTNPNLPIEEKDLEKEIVFNYDTIGVAMRPQRLKDYFGQDQAVAILSDAIKKARLSGSAIPHILLFGSQGLGKTTLAKIIANEMNVNFFEISNTKNLTDETLIEILKKLKDRDIVFIDEIHNLPSAVIEGILYSAMEDFTVKYVQGKGKFAKTISLDLPNFTLIGATTEAGKLLKPFKDRFGLECRLVPYTDSILASIAMNSFSKLGMHITYENAMLIAKRSRSTPRLTNRFVARIADKAIVKKAEELHIEENGSLSKLENIINLNINVEKDIIETYFEENGIDGLGLNSGDREILKILIEKFNGGPTGQEIIAKAMNESVNVISEQYENYLVRLGFINITPKGRVVMPKAYQYLNVPMSEQKKTSKELETTKPKLEKKETFTKKNEFVITFNNKNPERLSKVQQLMQMEFSKPFSNVDLDTLFPDVDRTYESAAKNISTIIWENGSKKRELYCDSKLERRFISYISSCGFIKDIKTQCVLLEYSSEKMDHKTYYPDFVLQTQDDKIIIVEMKNVTSMSYHLNIDKYNALKKYAAENDYGYAEIGKIEEPYPRYISFEEIKNLEQNQTLKDYINNVILLKKEFTQEELNTFKTNNKDLNDLAIHTIILNDSTLSNYDKTGTNILIKRSPICNENE